MEQTGYGAHIARAVRSVPYETAIETEDIAKQLVKEFAIPYGQAKTITNVKLKRMADKGKIERLQKGIYCHVKQTVFGTMTPDIDQVMLKTLILQDGERIGYESGASLFNKLGLTTLTPRNIEITTNRFEVKLPEGCHLKLQRPHTAVTGNNWKYLQFIGILDELPYTYTDVKNAKQILLQYAKKQQLDDLTLIFTARRYYPQKIVLQLIDLLRGVENETTSR